MTSPGPLVGPIERRLFSVHVARRGLARTPARAYKEGMAKKKSSELGGPRQAVTVAVSTVELALTVIALVHLVKRPPEDVRGPKRLWAVGVLIQPVGPIAYLARGRHASGAPA
jgi:hypothetical protein